MEPSTTLLDKPVKIVLLMISNVTLCAVVQQCRSLLIEEVRAPVSADWFSVCTTTEGYYLN